MPGNEAWNYVRLGDQKKNQQFFICIWYKSFVDGTILGDHLSILFGGEIRSSCNHQSPYVTFGKESQTQMGYTVYIGRHGEQTGIYWNLLEQSSLLHYYLVDSEVTPEKPERNNELRSGSLKGWLTAETLRYELLFNTIFAVIDRKEENDAAEAMIIWDLCCTSSEFQISFPVQAMTGTVAKF